MDGPLLLELTADHQGSLRASFRRSDAVALALALDRPTSFEPRTASARLDRLIVELEEPGRGPTYDLMIAAPAPQPIAPGGFLWVPVDVEHPPEALRLFGQRGASLYEAVLGPWDDAIEQERERLAWAELPVSFRRLEEPVDQ